MEQLDDAARYAMSSACWNVVGLLLVFVGVIILFRYGMPYRVRRGGASYVLREEVDKNGLQKEKTYDVLGWIGLILISAGTLAQIRASLM